MQSFVLVNLAKTVFVNVKIVADVFARRYWNKVPDQTKREGKELLTKWFLFCNNFTGKTCKPKGTDICGPEPRGTTLLISEIIGRCSQVAQIVKSCNHDYKVIMSSRVCYASRWLPLIMEGITSERVNGTGTTFPIQYIGGSTKHLECRPSISRQEYLAMLGLGGATIGASEELMHLFDL